MPILRGGNGCGQNIVKHYNRAKLVFLIIAKFEMLLCSFSADDCSSCVQRSFKVHELLKKACHEYDFGEKRLIDEIKQPHTVF